MDVAYILGSGSKWNNNELRYSLRSLERFGENISRVFVIGENPGFLSEQITYKYVPDTGTRSWNHASKVLRAFFDLDIKRALLNYDDNFFLKPFDCEKYPYYHRGELPSEVRYKQDWPGFNSYNFLEEHDKPTSDFGVHCPIIYERSSFIALSEVWQRMRAHGAGMSVRSVYANWYELDSVYMKDCKIGGSSEPVRTVSDVRRRAEGRHVISIHDNAIENGVAEFLELIFPEPSKYEK